MARKTTAKKAVRKTAKKPRGPKGRYTRKPRAKTATVSAAAAEPVRVLRRIHGRLTTRAEA